MKPWLHYYRPAQDWRSGLPDAFEWRAGVWGWQVGLIFGVQCGLGLALWDRQYTPRWSQNWFPLQTV